MRIFENILFLLSLLLFNINAHINVILNNLIFENIYMIKLRHNLKKRSIPTNTHLIYSNVRAYVRYLCYTSCKFVKIPFLIVEA